MVVDELQRDGDSCAGNWAIVHVDTKGRQLTAWFDFFAYTNRGATAEELPLEPAASSGFFVTQSGGEHTSVSGDTFDWDGDGEDEFLVVGSRMSMNVEQSTGRIWTFKNRGITLYPHTRNWDVRELKDFDGDGRMDLVVYVGGGQYISTTNAKRMFADELLLLAHSLPDGKFTFNDDVAFRHAKSVCPKPSQNLSTQKEVLCARVWGMNPAAISGAIARGCKQQRNEGECEDRPMLEALVTDLRVPVVLPKEAR